MEVMSATTWSEHLKPVCAAVLHRVRCPRHLRPDLAGNVAAWVYGNYAQRRTRTAHPNRNFIARDVARRAVAWIRSECTREQVAPETVTDDGQFVRWRQDRDRRRPAKRTGDLQQIVTRRMQALGLTDWRLAYLMGVEPTPVRGWRLHGWAMTEANRAKMLQLLQLEGTDNAEA